MDINCLASYVIFRELYDNNKSDIYSIVSKFAAEIISTDNLHSFAPAELTIRINQKYGFNLPENVVKASLARLSYVNNSGYNLFHADIGNREAALVDDIAEKMDDAKESSEKVVELLINHVETTEKTTLDLNSKEELVNSFCTFLLDGDNGIKFSKCISSFLISNQINESVVKAVDAIREGAILYAGLNYNIDAGVQKRWPHNLNVFLDLEILFFLAGYNGETYQVMVKDLIQLVKELNSRSNNRLKLYYSSDVEQRMIDFFKTAEEIVSGKRPLAQNSNNAMREILQNCRTASDVVEKRNRLFSLFRNTGIFKYEDEPDLFDKENYHNNLESKEIVEKFGIDESNYKSLSYLNYINALRKDQVYFDLQQVGSILLTETRLTKTLAVEFANVAGENSVPLAISLQTLTNRLWYDLNKGFGAKNFPKSLGILVKARIVLAGIIGQAIKQKYTSASEKFKSGEINEETMKSTLVDLRSQNIKPEEITRENVLDIIDSIEISDDEVAEFRDSNRYLRSKLRTEEEQRTRLEGIVAEKAQSEKEAVQIALKSIDSQLKVLNRNMQVADRKIKKRMLINKIIVIFFSFAVIVAAFIAYYYNLGILATVFTVLSLISILLHPVYSLICDKKFDFLALVHKWGDRVKERYYSKYEVDIEEMTRLSEYRKRLLMSNDN